MLFKFRGVEENVRLSASLEKSSFLKNKQQQLLFTLFSWIEKIIEKVFSMTLLEFLFIHSRKD